MKSIAPVALFVYNRLDNTRQTIAHLLNNMLAPRTDLYVFSDGGRDAESWKQVQAIRDYLQNLKAEQEGKGLGRITLVFRNENIYLERNIIEGITQVFESHDRIIVLEDDICTSPYYLQYMNDAFEAYKYTPQVMHVSGFTNLNLHLDHPIYFTPHMSGWGWGTWRDRWQKHFRHFTSREEALADFSTADLHRIEYQGAFPCLKSLDKRPIPWDICWELAIYRAQGLCLTPCHTMVRNIGLYNGTHFQHSRLLQSFNFDRTPWPHQVTIPLLTPKENPVIEEMFRKAIRHWGIRYTILGHIVRFLYLKLKGLKK